MTRRSAVLGYVVMIVLLSAGAAQSLAGSNTVFSDDIVNEQVGYTDLKDGAVGGKKILNNAVTGAKIYPNTITGSDIGTLAPKILRARVATFQGVVQKFDGATGVSRTNIGKYRLTFASNVRNCAGSASPGTTGFTGVNQGSTGHLSSSVTYFGSTLGTNQVDVEFFNGSTPTDTSFSVILACP